MVSSLSQAYTMYTSKHPQVVLGLYNSLPMMLTHSL